MKWEGPIEQEDERCMWPGNVQYSIPGLICLISRAGRVVNLLATCRSIFRAEITGNKQKEEGWKGRGALTMYCVLMSGISMLREPTLID